MDRTIMNKAFGAKHEFLSVTEAPCVRHRDSSTSAEGVHKRGEMQQIATANPKRILNRIADCGTCQLRAQQNRKLNGDVLDQLVAFKKHHSRHWAGEQLLEQGSTTPTLFTLFSGIAVNYYTLKTGERQLISVLTPGSLVGLETMLGASATCSTHALTDLTCCRFDTSRFRDVMMIPELAHEIIRIQSAQTQLITLRRAAIGASDAVRSLAHFILDLHRRMLRANMARETEFRLPLTMQQLGEALGITPVHVHRVARQLKQQNILSIEGRRVSIYDMAALTRVAAIDVADLNDLDNALL